jgi:hypothetical protein
MPCTTTGLPPDAARYWEVVDAEQLVVASGSESD